MVTDYKNLLKQYLVVTKTLRKQYNVYKRDILSPEWIEFNENVASSLSYLYRLSIPLYKSLKDSNLFKDKDKDKDFTYKNSRLYSFYYDFIVSKPSNTIFTETPKEAKVNLYPRTPQGIAFQFNLLFQIIEDYKTYNKIKEIKEIKKEKNLKERIFLIFRLLYLKIKHFFIKVRLEDEKRTRFELEFNRHFQIAFQRAFLFYDFIFYGDEGVFTKHAFCNELFEKTDKQLRLLIEKSDKRELFQKIVLVCIDIATKHKMDERLYEDLKEYQHLEVYENYVKYQKLYANQPQKLIYVEPFTYVMANKVWKLDKIYQNRPEGCGQENELKEFEDTICTYIKETLNSIRSYYSNETSRHKLYANISKLDKGVINYIYENYLSDIAENDSRCENLSSGAKQKKSENTDLKNIIEKAIKKNKYDKFKFYRILQDGTKEDKDKDIDIETLLLALYSLIQESQNQKECNIHYIGILRSGAFLAHAMNVMSGSKNPAISMITHPFLTILPREKFKIVSDQDSQGNNGKSETKVKAVYIDEAIKSGYSANIIEVYREKFLLFEEDREDCESELYTLVDFKDYKNKVFTKHKALADIKSDKSNLLSIEDSECSIAFNFSWENYIKTIIASDKIASDKIKETAKINNNSNKYDLTKVISCSDMLFWIAYQFANAINTFNDSHIKDTNNNLNIACYAGSYEGKLLIDTTVFIYKMCFDEKIEFCIEPKKDLDKESLQEYRKYFFDISYVTGTTAKKVQELDALGEDFDHYFVIALEEANIEKAITAPINIPKLSFISRTLGVNRDFWSQVICRYRNIEEVNIKNTKFTKIFTFKEEIS